MGSSQSDVFTAFHDVVHEFGGGEKRGGGVPAMARLLGMPTGTLYNKANIHDNDNNHNKPTLKDAIQATLFSKDKRIVQAFSSMAGGVFFELPDMSGTPTDALIAHLTKIGKESGDFYARLDRAMRDGVDLSLDDYLDLKRESYEWIAAILETMARLAEMAEVE